MLKKHLYVIRSLSCGKKITIQKWEARCHTGNSVTNYLNENAPDNIRKQNWSPYSCDLNLLDYAICDIMKKILYKNLKRYENIKGPSAALSYVWDRLTKTSSIRISRRRRRWSHCTSNLTRPTHDSRYASIFIDILNMKKWL